MGAGELQGWHADPFLLHEARYFSAGRPTKLVRDGRVESFDEPPSGTPAPDAPTALALAPARALPGEPPPGTAEPAAPHDLGFVRRRPISGLSIFAGTVLIAAAVAVGVVAFTGVRPPKPAAVPGAGLSPVAFVTQSARATMGQRTADVTVSGSVQAGGKSVPVHGSGLVNFDTNAMAADIVEAKPGDSLTEKEIETGGSLYYTASVNGKPAVLPGGRTWIQLPVKNESSTNLTGSDPIAALNALAAQGNTVTKLGTGVIGGVTCTGYSVQPRLLPVFTLTVWIDSKSLVRELSASLRMSFNSSTVSGTIVMDFTHFGAPVRISPPPPSTVISYQAFLKEMGLSSLANLPGLASTPPKPS